MRRENRNQKNNKNLNIYYWGAAAIALFLVVFAIAYIIYGNSKTNTDNLSMQEFSNLDTTDLEDASSSIGKTVDESKNELNNTNTEKIAINTSNMENTKNTTSNTNTAKQSTTNKVKEDTAKETNAQKTEENKEVTFERPVSGDIMKEFAQENLVFSETLNEWITHNGIDLRAEKTEVVKAAADGTVKTIKNDPRYGLTITIEHDNGFKTVYANLLTSEFVVEGEKVQKGQTIGTVGNTAIFESSDDTHLHFEILKDNVNVDPATYLK